MTDRYTDIKQKLCACAETDSSIRAIIVIGSTVRQNPSADEFSDLDLMIVTDAPEVWCSGEYPKKLGSVRIAFTEPTLGGGTEYRCIDVAEKKGFAYPHKAEQCAAAYLSAYKVP